MLNNYLQTRRKYKSLTVGTGRGGARQRIFPYAYGICENDASLHIMEFTNIGRGVRDEK